MGDFDWMFDSKSPPKLPRPKLLPLAVIRCCACHLEYLGPEIVCVLVGSVP